jgi:hypothetical protein
MKKASWSIISIITLIITILIITGCKKKENPVKYTKGIFPDSLYSLTGLNTPYDDYNSDLKMFRNYVSIIFSSNRQSSGGQFDLVQGRITYAFVQSNGDFQISSVITTDQLNASVISKAITPGNDFGPYSLYSTSDGYNYFFISSQNGNSQLDLFYLKFLPQFGTAIPTITGPFPATLINSAYDDAYITFDINQDSLFFTSNRGGNYDIYLIKKSTTAVLDSWLNQSFTTAVPVDSINTSADEKCPFFLKNYMVFASNRPGGLGGYDLYYSVLRNGKWSAPVNFGPKVNSSSDEFRPILGYDENFSNMFMVFSSNRPGGLGGYDLYFTSFNNPK